MCGVINIPFLDIKIVLWKERLNEVNILVTKTFLFGKKISKSALSSFLLA